MVRIRSMYAVRVHVVKSCRTTRCILSQSHQPSKGMHQFLETTKIYILILTKRSICVKATNRPAYYLHIEPQSR